MSALEALQTTSDIGDLAMLLGFKRAGLAGILHGQSNAEKYKIFDIPKRGGGSRHICAPIGHLKTAQKNLSNLLQDCVDELNLKKGRKDRIAHGFKRKRSIMTNAAQHKGKRYVFNIDLKDFFPSINFGRVRGFFLKNREFLMKEKIATVIAQVACHENSLPQGSPCSPVISNLVAHVLDLRMVELASRNGCTYSRYADDLTFSSNKKRFPEEIAVPSQDGPHLWVPGPELLRRIKRAGFEVNQSKTRMQYRDSRQEVTGLVVNRKINVRSEYRRNVRAMVHRLFTKGAFEVLRSVKKESGEVALEKTEGSLNQLHGMLGFINTIDRLSGKTGQSSEKELMYRRFLLFKNFFAAEGPVVICEGETDNIYLLHAIRSLAKSFPDLAKIDAENKTSLKIRLYKYHDSSTGRIIGLNDGGSAALTRFISTYTQETKRFKAQGQKHPVIILYDNDQGANPIRSIIKQISGVKTTPQDPFVRIKGNLYAVPTPLLNSAGESKIEDFFDAKTKATEVAGKKFHDQNHFDSETHYGKMIFAHKVVAPKAESIDFQSFSPLLAILAEVINTHASQAVSMAGN